MNRRILFSAIMIPLAFSLPQGCGGDDVSSDETTGDGALNASSVSSADDLLSALEGLTFDEGSSSSRLSPRGAQANGPQPGDFSRLGCHYKADRARMFRDVTRVRAPLCYISHTEASHSDFVIPDEGYGYYKILNPDGDEADKKEFLLRIGRFTEEGRKCLRFQGCRDGVQDQSYEVCEIDGGVTANIEHEFTFTNPDSAETVTGAGSLAIVAKGASVEEITEVTVDSAHADQYWAGSASFSADKTLQRNEFIGKFEGGFGGFDSSSGVCVVAGGGSGSGLVAGTASFPPFCDPISSLCYCPNSDPSLPPDEVDPATTTVCSGITFSHTESFEIVEDGGEQKCTIIADADSPWYQEVLDCAAKIPSSPASPHSFGETWNCEAEGEFTAIEIVKADVQECHDLEQKGDRDEQMSCDQEVVEDQKDPNAAL